MPDENARPERPPSPEKRLAALFDATAEPAEPRQEEAPEAPPPKVKAKPKAEPAPADAAPEAPQEASEDAPKETAADVSDDDVPAVESLADLAEVLGTDVAELYNLRIPVTSADGERADVSLGEWKDAYQSSAKAQKLQAELESKRAAFEQHQAQVAQQIQGRLREVDALVNAAEGQLLSEYNAIDWNQLRQQDPADWAARRQDFIERQNAINEAKRKATDEATRLQAEQSEKAAKYRGEALQREAAALMAAIPDWKDEAKAKTEKAQLFDYLVSSGFKPDDVSSVIDHRVVVLARKAMLWDKRSTDGKDAIKKLVKVAPKRVLKPGAAQSKADQQADARASIRGRLKKSGRLEDFAALISRS